jgi:uncharacterized membrane protein
MLAYIVAYVASAIAFVAADATWLTLAGPRLYRPIIGPLLSGKVNGGAAVAFYLIYLAGVVFLAVAPALRSGQWRTAALNGLVLGLVAYGTYDLTNQATLRLWSTRLTLADMAWGGAVTALAAVIGFLAARKAGG